MIEPFLKTGRMRKMAREAYNELQIVKTEMILKAFDAYDVRSFVDLGGCYMVHGGYSLIGLLHFTNIDRAVIVDGRPTRTSFDRTQVFPELELIKGNFGDSSVLERVGGVDAVILFDVLLHQAEPDWRQILKLYATKCRVMLIYNQQWIGSRESRRLSELSKEDWLHETPLNFDAHGNILPHRQQYFENLDNINDELNQKWRDAWFVWQWGITDADLISEMWQNRFGLMSMKNHGQSFGLPNFEAHEFIFTKVKPWSF
jgi:hypothetical protein